MDILFLIGLALIFVGILLIILSIFLQSKKATKTDSGFVIVVWPFFIAGGNERLVSILLTLAIILSIILLATFLLRLFP